MTAIPCRMPGAAPQFTATAAAPVAAPVASGGYAAIYPATQPSAAQPAAAGCQLHRAPISLQKTALPGQQAAIATGFSPADKGVGVMATRFGGLQESDMLERLGEKYQNQGPADPHTSNVQLVSLGSYCGPKLSFQKMGRGAETLPFDWMRTRLDGILHFLRNSFAGFFDFETQQRVPDSAQMVMFRGFYHSFWHDDPTDPSMREKYQRRIARLWSINSAKRPVLFVRSMVSPEEVLQMPEFMTELSRCFGGDARMLLILENQARLQGPILIQDQPNLMLFYLSLRVHGAAHPDNPAPYARPTQCALDWCVGRTVQGLRQYPNVEAAFQVADQYPAGLKGLGGLDAFERTPPAFTSRRPMPYVSPELDVKPMRATELSADNTFPGLLAANPFALISPGAPPSLEVPDQFGLRPRDALARSEQPLPLRSPLLGLASAHDMAATAANFAPLP